MRSGLQAKQLTIRHVREPREGMPVRLMETGKSPNDIAGIQPCVDMNVPGDISAVIKREELVMRDPAIQQQSGKHEQGAQQNRFLAQMANPSLRGSGTHLCEVYHAIQALQAAATIAPLEGSPPQTANASTKRSQSVVSRL